LASTAKFPLSVVDPDEVRETGTNTEEMPILRYPIPGGFLRVFTLSGSEASLRFTETAYLQPSFF
jgi:hypothetical protein